MKKRLTRTAELVLLLSALWAAGVDRPLFAQDPPKKDPPECSTRFATLPNLPSGDVDYLKQVLDMQQAQIANSLQAQRMLFEAAVNMTEEMSRVGRQVLESLHPADAAPELGAATKHEHLIVKMKRDDPNGFMRAVLEKMERKGYRKVGQVPDLARGRIDLDSQDEMVAVVREFREYGHRNGYVVSVEGPRRPIRGWPDHFGYPRYHVTFKRQDGMEFEWQIGVSATTDVWERTGIEIPPGLHLPPGTTNDLHDIEYRIFQPIWKKAHEPNPDPVFVELDREFRLRAFSEHVDLLAARSAVAGHSLPNLDQQIRALHQRASAILQGLTRKMGSEFLERMFRVPPLKNPMKGEN